MLGSRPINALRRKRALMEAKQARRPQAVQEENRRLQRLVAELSVQIQITRR